MTEPVPPGIKRGSELDVTIESFADRGKSLARVDGFVVFVPGAVPGDTARIRIGRRKKHHAEAQLLELLSPSDLRIEPRCRYAMSCGGCKWQHVDYTAQRAMKRQSVEDALIRTGGLNLGEISVPPVLGAEERDGSGGVFFYRNKMEFSFSARRWLTPEEIESGESFDRDFALGLHVPGRFDKVLDLQECYLQSPWSVRLINAVRAFAKEGKWSAWNVHTHKGFLRHLVVRQSARTNDRLVNLVTSRHDPERNDAFAAFLRAEFPEVTTFVYTVNDRPAATSEGETRVVFGPGIIRDRIGRFTFEIAPGAFFQTNTVQAERMYEVVAEFAGFQKTDRVYDLYCGAGTISLFVSDRVKEVIGIEVVEDAVANARKNAEANGVENCRFFSGDVLEELTPSFVEEHGVPDVLIVDPPRAGLHPKVTRRILDLAPERLVYVSCNPQTQARDLATLTGDYEITRVQPVDMFPHTHHVENVVALERSNKQAVQ